MTIAHRIIRRIGRNRIGSSVQHDRQLAAAVSTLPLRVAHDIDLGKVVKLRHTPGNPDEIFHTPAHLSLPAICHLILCWTAFALRTIGYRAVPFQVAAVASFTSYTIGHALGAATLTGGAVRLRIYSVWGLSVVDIAKIAFVTGMTFSLLAPIYMQSARLPASAGCGQRR